MSTINYRFLTNDDAKQYHLARLLSFKESPLAFSESFEDENKKDYLSFLNEIQIIGDPPEHFILGAFDQNKLIGFVKFRRDQRSKARHKAMIHAMYVHPDFRKKNIGKQLIHELLVYAKKLQGLEAIHLWVLHANGKSAADFYRSCGFMGQGPLVKQDLKINDVYIDAEYMTMQLY